VVAAPAPVTDGEWIRSGGAGPPELKSPEDSLVGECDGEGAFKDRLL